MRNHDDQMRQMKQDMFHQCAKTEIILDPKKLNAEVRVGNEKVNPNDRITLTVSGGQYPTQEFIDILEGIAGPVGAEDVFRTLHKHQAAKMFAEAVSCHPIVEAH